MYLETIANQTHVFLYSCGFGFFLQLVFEAFVFLRLLLPKGKFITFTTDFLYMAVCTFLMFIFSLSVNEGNIRFYVYFGAAAGWVVSYFSAGAFFRKISAGICSKIKTVFSKFKRGILTLKRKFSEKRAKKLKKSEISSNLLLQDDETLLYNVEE